MIKPKPWTADIGDKRATIHERDTGKLIAEIRLGGAEGYDSSMRDAALVAAAAPEMLEALRAAQHALPFNTHPRNDTEALQLAVYLSVVEAIKKAEGR